MGHHGILKVTLIEARQLKDKNILHKHNAYVEIYLDRDYKQRTTTIKDSNNPIWNEIFTFNLEKHQDRLHIHVYNDDVIRRDSIGSTKINLKKHVFGKGPYEKWCKLTNDLSFRSHGRVHLILEHLF